MEAVATLLIASLMVRFLAFHHLAAVVSGPIRRGSSSVRHDADLKEIRWAIEAVAVRVPWRAVCIQKGVAAQLMLRRRKLPAALHYGISTHTSGSLEAHVWVTSGSHAVVGGETADRFACVAVFPGPE
jgi:hypothetical protein